MDDSKLKFCSRNNDKLVINNANRDILILVLLCKVMKLDLRVLLYLYDKYKEDVFFIFYMFAGMELKFPSFDKFYKMIKCVDDLISNNEKIDSKYSDKISDEVEMVKKSGILKFDMNDRELFPFGREGVILGAES